MAIQTTITYERELTSFVVEDSTIAGIFPLKRDCGTCSEEGETCPTCSNDLPFYRFAKCDSYLHLQFNFIDEWNDNPLNPTEGWKDGWLDISLITPTQEITFDDMVELCSEWMVGATEEGLTYQNLIIDMTKVCELIGDEKCFYFKITNCKPGYGEPDYVAERCADLGGVAPTSTSGWAVGTYYFDTTYWNLWVFNGTSWDAVTLGADTVVYCVGQGIFYQRSGDVFVEIDNPYEDPDPENPDCTNCYTELFRVPTCEEVVTFSCDWSEFDCLGFYHGLADNYAGSSNFAYNPSLTVRGNIEIVSFPVATEETEEGTVTEVTWSESALFRAYGMPQLYARRLTNYLMQRPFYINDEVWDTYTNPEKNNDNGLHWWLEMTFEREICKRNTFECD